MKSTNNQFISGMTLVLLSLMLFNCNNESVTESKKTFPTKQELKPENPLERELWELERKGGSIDPEVVLRARQSFQKKFLAQSNIPQKDAGLNNWTEYGPNAVGGRIRSIAVDPNNNNHIFVGSVGGGIWETTNGGTTWNNKSDFLESLSFTQILYDPNNSNTIYASTGEGYQILGTGGNTGQQGTGGALSGVGVYKSTNGGSTWSLLPTPANQNFFFVNDIALDPNNANWIYAVTTDVDNNTNSPNNSTNPGDIFLSKDGGMTWNNVGATLSAGLDVKIHPTNSNIVIVGCGAHMYRSSNATATNPTFTEITGGTNQIPGGGRIELSWAQSFTSRVYASVNRNGGEVWRSNDSGVTWTERTANTTPSTDCNNSAYNLLAAGWFANTIWVDPTNSSRLIVGSVDLFRSTDGGNNFTMISSWCDDINGNSNGGNNSIHADHHVIVPYNNYNGTSSTSGVYFGNDGGIYSASNVWTVSQNSGWTSRVGNIGITQFYGGSIGSGGSTVIGGAQDNSFSFSTNSGSTWTQPFTGDGAYAEVDFTNDQIIYANLNNQRIFKTTDGGLNWNWIAWFRDNTCTSNTGCTSSSQGYFGVNDGARLISLFVMDPNNANTLVVGANRLWRNNQAGDEDDWTVIKPSIGAPTVTAIEVDFGSSSRIWTGYSNGRLERTTNTGGSWSGDISPSGLPPNPFVTDICVNPNNSNEVIVSYGGYNTNNLFYTSNGNSVNPTWSNINVGMNIQINTIEWHPSNSNWVYVGTDFGLLASEDKGQNWSITPLYDSNEGPVNTEISDIFWQPNSTRLCAATHGRGIWRSNAIKDEIYVDKDRNCNFPLICNGSFAFPYNEFQDALDAAGHGSEIIFLSSGTHDEIAANQDILIEKRIKITLDNGGGAVIIE